MEGTGSGLRRKSSIAHDVQVHGRNDLRGSLLPLLPTCRQTLRYLCSLPADKRAAQRVGGIIRAHWGLENRLHRMLDIHFNQDRMLATDIDDISNRAALNKLALALVENDRYWLWLHGKTELVMSTRNHALLSQFRQCPALSGLFSGTRIKLTCVRPELTFHGKKC